MPPRTLILEPEAPQALALTEEPQSPRALVLDPEVSSPTSLVLEPEAPPPDASATSPAVPEAGSTWRDRLFKAGEETLADPNATRAERFLAGLTLGMRESARGMGSSPEIPTKVAEYAISPFTVPYEGLLRALIEAGVITPRTAEQVTKSLIGATPALTAPRGAPRPRAGAVEPVRLREGMLEKAPEVRPIPEPRPGEVPPTPEPVRAVAETPPITEAPAPAEFPLAAGDVVEYRPTLSEKPVTGVVTNLNADGTVNVRARDSGVLRKVPRESLLRPGEPEAVGLESARLGKRVTLGEADAAVLGEMKETIRTVESEPTLGRRFTVEHGEETVEAAPSALEVKGYRTGKPSWMEIPGRSGEFHDYGDVLKAIESLERGTWPGTARRQRIAEQLLQEIRFDAEQEKARLAGYKAEAERLPAAPPEPMPREQAIRDQFFAEVDRLAAEEARAAGASPPEPLLARDTGVPTSESTRKEEFRPSREAATAPAPEAGALSPEELARQETFYRAKANGEITYLGKQPDAPLKPREAILAVDQAGTLRVQESLKAGSDNDVLARFGKKIRAAVAAAKKPEAPAGPVVELTPRPEPVAPTPVQPSARAGFERRAEEVKPEKPREPEPSRTLWVGRGQHGSVRVVFPDKVHADLYAAVGRSRRAMRQEPTPPADWRGLAARLDIPEREVGRLATEYREGINQAVKGLEEGETYRAPAYTLAGEETAISAPTVREEPARIGAKPSETEPPSPGGAARTPEPARQIVYGGRSYDYVPWESRQKETRKWTTARPVQGPGGEWTLQDVGPSPVPESSGGPAAPKPAGAAVPPPRGEPTVTLGSLGGTLQEVAHFLPESLRRLPEQYRTVVDKGIQRLTERMPKVLREARGLGEEFVDLIHDRNAALATSVERAVELGGTLQAGLTRGEQLRLDQVLRGGITTNPRVRGLVEPARTLIDQLEAKLVKAGYLTPEAVREFTDRFTSNPQYLRRLYTAKLLDPPKPVITVERTGPSVKSPTFLPRGETLEVTLPLSGGEPLTGRAREEFLRPYLRQGYRLRRVDAGKAVLFQDIPEGVRRQLGEVRDQPGFVAAHTIAEQARVVANHEFLDAIRQNPEWAKPALTEAELASGEWTRLPGDKTKWGPLADHFVTKDVAKEVAESIRLRQDWEKVLDRLVGMWKYSKVVLNPAAIGRNTMSSAILADFGGLHPYRLDAYAAGARDLANRGGYVAEAKAQGLFRTNFAWNELGQLSEGILRSTEGNGILRVLDGIRDLTEAARARTGISPAKLYGAVENFYRYNLFRFGREELGLSPKDARRYALKYAIDYQVVSPAVGFLRRVPVLGTPFVTFASKAIPLTLETLARHPLRVLKYPALVYGVQKLAEAQIGQKPEETEAQRKLGEMSAARYALLPVRDKDGRAQYLDLGYILPFGDLLELADALQGEGRRANISFLPIVTNPAFAIAEVLLNRSSFTGKDLAGPADTGVEAFRKKVEHLANAWGPSLLPPLPGTQKGGYGYEDVRRAFAGETDWLGRTRSVQSALLANLVGLRARGVTTEELANFKLRQVYAQLDALEKDAVRVASTLREQPAQRQLELRPILARMREVAKQGVAIAEAMQTVRTARTSGPPESRPSPGRASRPPAGP